MRISGPEGTPPVWPVLLSSPLNKRKPKTLPLLGETLEKIDATTEELSEEIGGVEERPTEEGGINRLA